MWAADRMWHFPPSQTGAVFSEQGLPSLAAHYPAPGQHQVRVRGQSMSLKVSCPSDPPEAGAVWHTDWTHRPLHL